MIILERAKSSNFVTSVFKGVIIAMIFTLICLTVFSLLLINTNMTENLIQPVVIGITIVSILIGSFFSNRKRNKNGVFNGCIVGIIYIAIIYIISSILNSMNFALNSSSIIMISLGLLGGTIGGIIGVNLG